MSTLAAETNICNFTTYLVWKIALEFHWIIINIKSNRQSVTWIRWRRGRTNKQWELSNNKNDISIRRARKWEGEEWAEHERQQQRKAEGAERTRRRRRRTKIKRRRSRRIKENKEGQIRTSEHQQE